MAKPKTNIQLMSLKSQRRKTKNQNQYPAYAANNSDDGKTRRSKPCRKKLNPVFVKLFIQHQKCDAEPRINLFYFEYSKSQS